MSRASAQQPGQHNHHGYRPPSQCPVCADDLKVTQLGCDSCGTGLSGHFQQCEFCALDQSELDVLRVFLASRGNMKELERHLGVSYPTARARFDELLGKLGLRTTAAASAAEPVTPEPAPKSEKERLDTLQALATGELDREAARRLLGS